jgi:hypothetical protein
MNRDSWVNKLFLVFTLLLLATGVSLAASNEAPATPTGNNVATDGTDNQPDRFVGVDIATANTLFVLGGQYYSTNNNSAFYVHTTNTASFTPFAGGGTANDLLVEDYVYVSATPLHLSLGTRIVTATTEEYGNATIFNVGGTAVWTVNDAGEASEVTRFHTGIYLAAGTNAGDFLLAGETSGSATGVTDAYFEIRQAADGALLNPADNTTTGAVAVQWGTALHTQKINGVIERADGNLIVVGLDDNAGTPDFYFDEVI